MIGLSSGAILAAASGPHEGRGHGELELSRTLLPAFSRGDVALADALYANYWFVADLLAAGVDFVLEQHGSRITDFRRGERLGSRDHAVDWAKPAAVPAWMSREQYRAYPRRLRLREARVGHRVLVTSLLAPRAVPKSELDALYRQRWHIELDLRSIKTTLGLDILRCRSPEMIEKEFWVHLLAYNLIRLLMAQAAAVHGTTSRAISFKHAVQLFGEFQLRDLCRARAPTLALLFRLIAQSRVGHRPGRCEPRARKRRPKSAPWLKVPRHVARSRNPAQPTWQRVRVK